jgi:hypothetical protein
VFDSTVVLPSHPLDRAAARLSRSRAAADLLGALDLLLRDRTALIAWLRALADSPEELAAVVAGSYWHANGFAKLVLHDTPDFRIRLHVWPAADGYRGEPDPHSHRWDFASTVLVGAGLEIVESDELPARASAADQECVRYTYDGFELVPEEGTVFLHEHRRFAVRPGDRYTTETTTIHTVATKGNDLVATLVVQGPHTDSATAVYGTELAALVDRPGRAIDADDVREQILAVADTLDSRG